jgi:hypothetical protein
MEVSVMRVITTTYDPECRALAESFLRDEPSVRGDPELFVMCCDDPALEIQEAIEQWFFISIPPERSE